MLAYQDAFNSEAAYSSQSSTMQDSLGILNSVLLMLMGSVIGFPIVAASGNTSFSSFGFHCCSIN